MQAPHLREANTTLLPAGEQAIAADVVNVLRVDIIDGLLQPGSRLRFADLQSRYGVGVSPLREALSRLTSDRLVIQEPNRGFHVPWLTVADFRDITKSRIFIEGHAAEESIKNGGEEWEEKLILAHHRLKRLERNEAKAGGEVVSAEWEKRHRAFHQALISSCGSEWILHFCDVLYDQFDRYRRAAGRSGNTQLVLAQQHDRLIDAAIQKNGDSVRDIMMLHIAEVASEVLRRLEPNLAKPVQDAPAV